MSYSIFVPRLAVPYREGPAHKTKIGEMGGGLDVAVNEWPIYGRLVVDGALRLPQSDLSETYDTFAEFVQAMRGRKESFLYAPRFEPNGKRTSEAVGIGDASETKFALDFLYPRTGTFTVTVGGTPSVEGFGWSLSNADGSAWTLGSGIPYLKFASPPAGSAAIVASYWYYRPMRFDRDDVLLDLVLRAQGSTSAGSTFFLDSLRMVQDAPGSHLSVPA